MKINFEALRVVVDASFSLPNGTVLLPAPIDRLGYDQHGLIHPITSRYIALEETVSGEKLCPQDKVDIAHTIGGLLRAGRRLGLDAAINTLEEIQNKCGKIVAVTSYTPCTLLPFLDAQGVARVVVGFANKYFDISIQDDYQSITNVKFAQYEHLESLINAACNVFVLDQGYTQEQKFIADTKLVEKFTANKAAAVIEPVSPKTAASTLPAFAAHTNQIDSLVASATRATEEASSVTSDWEDLANMDVAGLNEERPRSRQSSSLS